MIPINQSELNTVVATCSRNKQLTGNVYYLWTMTHKLTKQNWKFIPYLLPATGAIGYEPSYDQFQIFLPSILDKYSPKLVLVKLKKALEIYFYRSNVF